MARTSTQGTAGTFEIGVVIAGAGARGAYEAGLLAYLLPEIAMRIQAGGKVARFWFIGTSAGSLNSVLIASRAPRIQACDTPEEVHAQWTTAMDEVGRVWGSISEGRVLGLPPARLLGAFTRLLPVGRVRQFSLLNVDPLEQLAQDPSVVDWDQLRERVADGTVGVVGAAVTARDGRTVIFLDRHQADGPIPRDDARDIDYVDCNDGIEAAHVLASSAIPCAFPAQWISRPEQWAGWYYDGGVRLNTPLKPAIELGLNHLVVVGTHPDSYARGGQPPWMPTPPEIDEAAVPVANQIMADQLIQDLQTLRSRNRSSPTTAIHYLFAGPSSFDTLADLARNSATQWTFARALRKALSPAARDELSSYLLFDKGYLIASVKAGSERAAATGTLPKGSESIDWRT